MKVKQRPEKIYLKCFIMKFAYIKKKSVGKKKKFFHKKLFSYEIVISLKVNGLKLQHVY